VHRKGDRNPKKEQLIALGKTRLIQTASLKFIVVLNSRRYEMLFFTQIIIDAKNTRSRDNARLFATRDRELRVA